MGREERERIFPYTNVPAFMFWDLPKPGEFDRVIRAFGAAAPMWPWQDGRCAMCGARSSSLVEDHDHTTGLTRGLLCRGCNFAESTAYRHAAFHAWCAGMNPARIFGWDEWRHAGRQTQSKGLGAPSRLRRFDF